ncbi:MAG TPA: alpha/beta fold hydrolase [Solirubrobacteraceae bacterium]|nr:alpha/beta fold hydrolase [Solirubrobacteraceae bacterium]
MSAPAPRIAFFPGAAGSPAFWAPVAERLPDRWEKTLLGWPGAGEQPHDPGVRSFEDLVRRAAGLLDEQTDIVAQSMGCVVAIGLALRHPERVRRLVLVAASGGIDVGALGGVEWRDEYVTAYPQAGRWLSTERPDYTAELARLAAPTLLVSGDADLLSPPAVGQRLRELIPGSSVRVLRGGTHWMATERPDEVARLIGDHLGQ